MSTKAAMSQKRRRTTSVPVTTMEEIPVLDEQEREELIRALQEAERRAERGEAVDYDPQDFKRRLIEKYRGSKR